MKYVIKCQKNKLTFSELIIDYTDVFDLFRNGRVSRMDGLTLNIEKYRFK